MNRKLKTRQIKYDNKRLIYYSFSNNDTSSSSTSSSSNIKSNVAVAWISFVVNCATLLEVGVDVVVLIPLVFKAVEKLADKSFDVVAVETLVFRTDGNLVEENVVVTVEMANIVVEDTGEVFLTLTALGGTYLLVVVAILVFFTAFGETEVVKGEESAIVKTRLKSFITNTEYSSIYSRTSHISQFLIRSECYRPTRFKMRFMIRF